MQNGKRTLMVFVAIFLVLTISPLRYRVMLPRIKANPRNVAEVFPKLLMLQNPTVYDLVSNEQHDELTAYISAYDPIKCKWLDFETTRWTSIVKTASGNEWETYHYSRLCTTSTGFCSISIAPYQVEKQENRWMVTEFSAEIVEGCES